jgi:hypothetical protein
VPGMEVPGPSARVGGESVAGPCGLKTGTRDTVLDSAEEGVDIAADVDGAAVAG